MYRDCTNRSLTERLFLDDARIVGRVVDDRGLHEEALARADLRLAYGELVAMALGVLEERLDLLVLPDRPLAENTKA